MEYYRLVAEVFDNCLGVKNGDAVWVSSWDNTLDLADTMQMAQDIHNPLRENGGDRGYDRNSRKSKTAWIESHGMEERYVPGLPCRSQRDCEEKHGIV